jgi:hypothetical protein
MAGATPVSRSVYPRFAARHGLHELDDLIGPKLDTAAESCSHRLEYRIHPAVRRQ